MAFTTAVPSVTFGNNGFVVPAELSVLAGVQVDINAAFNNKLNFTTTGGAVVNATPQGQWSSSLTAVVSDVQSKFAFLAQMFDPAYAFGRYQDAIGRMYFMERNPAQPSVLQVNCIGTVNVTIPVGARLEDNAGNFWICSQAGTFGVSGNMTLTFQSAALGPIAIPATGNISIYTQISGWDSISVVSGVLGNVVESRTDYETRRQNSVAKNSNGAVGSVRGAVLAVNNVIDAYVIENNLSSPLLVGDFTLGPNSIYVAAVGGLATDIANAIITKKGPGCSYNGNTQVVVTDAGDPKDPYNPPLPSYTVSFEIPTNLQTYMTVTITNSPLVPSNATTLIQQAIINAFAGLDGGSRVRIGGTLYAARYYPPVQAVGSWVNIVNIKLSVGSDMSASKDSALVFIDQYPVISAGNIQVVTV